jgi:uncharacterized OB-fold protein
MRSVLPEDWTRPAVDALNEAFFRSGRLVLQRCAGCGTIQHPPEELCHRCHGTSFEEAQDEGRGTVYSYTVVHHPPHPKLSGAVPYTVVLVSLDDHPEVRITGNLVGVAPDAVSIGLPVRVFWDEIDDDDGTVLRLPQWEASS